MKKFIVLLTVLMIFGGGYYFVSQSGNIIKSEIEKYGSDITGSTVTLESTEVSLPGSTLTLSNLVVGNPDGFATKNAFKLGKAVLLLKMDGDNPQTMHIESIVIEAPDIAYELINERSNLGILKYRIEQYSGRKITTNSTDGNIPLALVIDDLVIQDAKLDIAGKSNTGEDKIVLPEIRLQGIGTTDKAITPAEAIIQALTAVTAAIEKETTKQQDQQPAGNNTAEEAPASPVSAN